MIMNKGGSSEKGAKKYYDLQRNWTRKIVPHLKDEKLNAILVRDFNKFTMGSRAKPFLPGDLPENWDSCDWRFQGHCGRCPRFWSYVKHAACHWIVNFSLHLAQLAEPSRAWRIVTSQAHSTVWDGHSTLFDFNFLALGVPVNEAWELARGEKKFLAPGEELEVFFAEYWLLERPAANLSAYLESLSDSGLKTLVAELNIRSRAIGTQDEIWWSQKLSKLLTGPREELIDELEQEAAIDDER
jgi:hypothetical protein